MKNSRLTSTWLTAILFAAGAQTLGFLGAAVLFAEISPVISCERGELPAVCAQRAATLAN
jgi:hypothetical protein